jgi:hypothetical protein
MMAVKRQTISAGLIDGHWAIDAGNCRR